MALSNIDFEVKQGEVMALVGDNGAGKSTLIKGIAGIYEFDGGQVYFDSKPVHIRTPRDASALGIEVVYQDLALANNLDVVANMFLGREHGEDGGRDTQLAGGAHAALGSHPGCQPFRWSTPVDCGCQSRHVEFQTGNPG